MNQLPFSFNSLFAVLGPVLADLIVYAKRNGAKQNRIGSARMPISVSMIVLSSQLLVTVADGVPVFDIARSCKLDLAATAGLSDVQSQKACINDEKRARQQLGGQWSKFRASSKAECIPQESIGGKPSYVSLQTCLQMNQWAR
jgi:hypothetical protein